MGNSQSAARREKIREYIDANSKSPTIGAVYALIFGPLGCIYTNPKSTVLALLVAAALGMIYLPLVAVVWLACVILAPYQVRSYNNRVKRSARYVVI